MLISKLKIWDKIHNSTYKQIPDVDYPLQLIVYELIRLQLNRRILTQVQNRTNSVITTYSIRKYHQNK